MSAYGASNVVPVREWFLARRYIDTNAIFNTMDIYEPIIKDGMREAAIFHQWTEHAISAVYESLLPMPVELYESGRIIFFAEDQSANAYLLIGGEVEIFVDGGISFSEDTTHGCYWFGDEQLFADLPRMLSARAKTPCQVVVFPALSFATILNKFTGEEEESRKLSQLHSQWIRYFHTRDELIYKKHPFVSNIMWVQNVLRHSDAFKHCPHKFLYTISLATILKTVKSGEVVMSQEEGVEREMCLLLQGGCVVMRTNAQDSDENLYSGDVFYFNATYEEKSHVLALEGCVLGLLSKSAIEQVMAMYPDALVNVHWDEDI